MQGLGFPELAWLGCQPDGQSPDRETPAVVTTGNATWPVMFVLTALTTVTLL
jgi:hypothetical protein